MTILIPRPPKLQVKYFISYRKVGIWFSSVFTALFYTCSLIARACKYAFSQSFNKINELSRNQLKGDFLFSPALELSNTIQNEVAEGERAATLNSSCEVVLYNAWKIKYFEIVVRYFCLGCLTERKTLGNIKDNKFLRIRKGI